MSVEFTCGAPNEEAQERVQGALAAYLYGECDAAERSAIEAHLAICAACAAELASLGATRAALASWTPPEAELGFQIVSARDAAPPGAHVLRPAQWWQRPMPAWAQAAAALVIFAVGGLLGLRAGGAGSTPASIVTSVPAVATEGVSNASARSTVSARDLAALEQRLRRDMLQLRTTSDSAMSQRAAATRPASSDEQLLQRVRSLLADSEQRQQREFELRLSQVLRDVDVQRRTDLARIEQTFGQMEGITGAELLQQREAINFLQRVSTRRPQ